MSRVMYNGKRLIPAPQVTVVKTYQSNADGTKVGSEWNITINGILVGWMGSPNSHGTFWTLGGFPPDEVIADNSRLATIIRKGEALRTLFSTDGQELEIQSEDGSQPMKCNPKILNVTLNEGTWYDRLGYSITLTCSVLSINGQDVGEDNFEAYIENGEESWGVETNEEPQDFITQRTYKLSHTVTAKGKLVYASDGSLISDAWVQAQNWVLPRLGYDPSRVSGSAVTDASSTPYNHIITESIDKKSGQYSVTETWMLANDIALENYTISISNSLETSLTKVTIDGSVTGLEVRDAENSLVTKKYDNALAKFNTVISLAYGRAMQYCTAVKPGVNLNSSAVSQQTNVSPVTGTISYNYEFDDRPSNLINGARMESIIVTDNLPTDYCVPIFVIGRAQGPVLQNLNTSKETTRELSIELVMDGTYRPFSVNTNPRITSNVQNVIDSSKPIGNQVYVQDKKETWDIKTGRYTFNTTWIWES